MAPRLSVVVASAGDAQRLDEVVAPLIDEVAGTGGEIVVVVFGRGGRDLRQVGWQPPATAAVRVVAESVGGINAARNRGAREASGEVLLFLDDDVVPEPGLVASHIRGQAPNKFTVGDRRAPSPTRRTIASRRDWLEGAVAWAEYLDHRGQHDTPASLGFRDVTGCNLALSRADFLAQGGFDEALASGLRGGWELGHRLMAAGFELVYVPVARVSRRLGSPSIRSLVAGARGDGMSDVGIARRHPDLVRGLPIAEPVRGWRGRLGRAVLRAPWLAALANVIAVAQLLARVAGLSDLSRRLRDAMLTAAYWGGVRAALDTRWALQEIIACAPAPERILVDLEHALPDRLPVPTGVPAELVVRLDGKELDSVDLPAWASRSRTDVARRIVAGLDTDALARNVAVQRSLPLDPGADDEHG
ncbi:MAG: glycosyltransferase family 2 protein [Nitriliruptorales bacterium]|nr:glycosyltransferase family 2 protein [Nitriliruptorales bacterium]